MADTIQQDPSPFADVEPIYTYGDAEACEDGVLVALTQRDRCTRALFEDLAKYLPDSPPNRWPVDLFGYIAAAAKHDPGLRAEAACKGLFARHGSQISTDPAPLWMIRKDSESPITDLSETRPDDGSGFEIWIVTNELNGTTIMYPSDW